MTAEQLAKNLPGWLESKELVDMPYSVFDPETGIIEVRFRLRYKDYPFPPMPDSLRAELERAGGRWVKPAVSVG